jgi:hypothetical protein
MSMTRRTFMHAGAALALTAASYNRVLGANEKLSLSVLGSGNRGRSVLTEALKLKYPCVGVCDIAEFRMDAIAKPIKTTASTSRSTTKTPSRCSTINRSMR